MIIKHDFISDIIFMVNYFIIFADMIMLETTLVGYNSYVTIKT